jgi:hypothetical protein
VKPVRETMSSLPAKSKKAIPNGGRFSISGRPSFLSTAQLVGPCSASAATSCVSSTIETSKPIADRISHSSCRSCEQSR